MDGNTNLKQLLEKAAAEGTPLDLGPPPSDPGRRESWDINRTIAAADIMDVCLARPSSVHPRGLEVRWARVSGELNLTDVDMPHPITLVHCYFDEQLLLSDAHLRSISVEYSWIPHILAAGLTTLGPVSFAGSSIARGLRMRGARIGGYLTLRGADVGSQDLDEAKVAISANRIRTAGPVFLTSAVIDGSVVLRDANLMGLSAVNSTLRAGKGRAFDGIRLRAKAVLDFRGASIEGSMSLESAEVRGHVHLSRAICKGQLDFASAVIGGDLECVGTSVSVTDGVAVSCVGLNVGNINFTHGFQSSGGVDLQSAELRGDLDCTGGLFESPNDIAINGQGLRTDGNLYLQSPPTQGAMPTDTSESAFFAKGVGLLGAHIGGAFVCWDARIEATRPGLWGLDLSGCDVKADLWLGGTSVKGGVALHGAQVAGNVDMTDSRLEGLFANDLVLGAISLHVTGALKLGFAERPSGNIDLSHARVGRLEDTERTWPVETSGTQLGGSAVLTGFEYDALVSTLDVTARRRWLRQAPYSPQPFEQLSRVYRETGQEKLSREIAIEKRDVEAASEGRIARARATLLRLTIGYGYKPWRALAWLLIVFGLAVALSWFAAQNQAMIATKPPGGVAVVAAPSASTCINTYPCFNPVVYAAESVLPIVNLHQAEFWAPDGSRWPWLPFAVTGLTLVGWVLTSMLVAALAGFIKRS
jgi:hypothetical protein